MDVDLLGEAADRRIELESRCGDELLAVVGKPDGFHRRVKMRIPDKRGPRVGCLRVDDQLGRSQRGGGDVARRCGRATPEPETDPTYALRPTASLRQIAETFAASVEGGSQIVAPGLPPDLRCTAGESGCANEELDVPHYAVFAASDYDLLLMAGDAPAPARAGPRIFEHPGVAKELWTVHALTAGDLDARYLGSRATLDFLEKRQPLLSLHGHIHESPDESGVWKAIVGRTVCIQPGQSSSALTAVVGDLSTMRFDRGRRKASYELQEDTTLKGEFDIPPQVQDGLSAVYILRAMNFKVGDRITLPVHGVDKPLPDAPPEFGAAAKID